MARSVRASILAGLWGAAVGGVSVLYLPFPAEAIGTIAVPAMLLGSLAGLGASSIGQASAARGGVAGGSLAGARVIGGLFACISVGASFSRAPTFTSCVVVVGSVALGILLGCVGGGIGAYFMGKRSDAPPVAGRVVWAAATLVAASALALLGGIASVRDHRNKSLLEQSCRPIRRALVEDGFGIVRCRSTITSGVVVEGVGGILSAKSAKAIVGAGTVDVVLLKQRDGVPLSEEVVEALAVGGRSATETTVPFGAGTLRIERVPEDVGR